MKKIYLLLPVLGLLFSCGQQNENSGGYKPGRDYGDDNYYAFYMLNYPRVTDQTPNGYQEKYDNPLYLREKVEIGDYLTEPIAPTRDKYEFQGWFRETSCTNPWSFELDQIEGSTYLYAKWGRTSGEDYIEPEYVYPERIIDDMNFKVTGILNKPLNGSQVNLTAGGINRLKEHPEDVRFAVNYERKESVTLDEATFNTSTNRINIRVSSGETWEIKVNDITSSLSIAYASAYYETKAQRYEANGKDIENYHVALGGSSSMENWSTSTEDMDPIVSFNHGIGGTTVEQWTNLLFERLIMPYSPKVVVYYVGVNNIINGSDNGTATGNKLKSLFDKTHQYLPNAQIVYVLINKLPGYLNRQNDFDTANKKALDYAEEHDYLTCVDAGVGLLKDNGLPHSGYFRPDGLHMSKYGYVIWGAAVKQAVIDCLERLR